MTLNRAASLFHFSLFEEAEGHIWSTSSHKSVCRLHTGSRGKQGLFMFSNNSGHGDVCLPLSDEDFPWEFGLLVAGGDVLELFLPF